MSLNPMYDRLLDDERESDIEGGTSLPSAGTHLFQLFVNTISNVLYYWSGSAWVALGGSTPPSSAAFLFINGTGFNFIDGTEFDFV